MRLLDAIFIKFLHFHKTHWLATIVLSKTYSQLCFSTIKANILLKITDVMVRSFLHNYMNSNELPIYISRSIDLRAIFPFDLYISPHLITTFSFVTLVLRPIFVMHCWLCVEGKYYFSIRHVQLSAHTQYILTANKVSGADKANGTTLNIDFTFFVTFCLFCEQQKKSTERVESKLNWSTTTNKRTNTESYFEIEPIWIA